MEQYDETQYNEMLKDQLGQSISLRSLYTLEVNDKSFKINVIACLTF